MIRTIRFLGAALGGLIGIILVITQLAVFQPAPGSPLLVVGWVVAWIVLGFTLLPYLTVIPALAALRAVQELSTAEFVTAIIGLFLGLLLGLLVGLPLPANLPSPSGPCAARPVDLPRARHGRADRREAARPHHRGRGSGHHQAPGRRGGVGRSRGSSSTRARSSTVGSRTSPSRASCSACSRCPRFVLDEVQRLADSSDSMRRTRGRRGLEILARMRKGEATPVQVIDEDVPGHARGRLEARRPRAQERPRDPDERPQPQPDRRPPGRARPQRQLARERGQAGPSARARTFASA